MKKNTMPLSPRSRFGPPRRLSDRRIGSPILSTSGNRVRFGLILASIYGMSAKVPFGNVSQSINI